MTFEEAETMFPGSTVQLDYEASQVVEGDSNFRLQLQNGILEACSETTAKFKIPGGGSRITSVLHKSIWVQIEGEWHWSKVMSWKWKTMPHWVVGGAMPKSVEHRHTELGAGTYYFYIRQGQGWPRLETQWAVRKVMGDGMLYAPVAQYLIDEDGSRELIASVGMHRMDGSVALRF